MSQVIPVTFTESSKIAAHRQRSVSRLVATPSSRISDSVLDAFTNEEQIFIYQIAIATISDPTYKDCCPQMGDLAARLRDYLTTKHWSLMGRRALAYYQRFNDIGTQGEFFSEAYIGFEKGMVTYDGGKGRAREGGCKVKNWLGKQIELRILDFISEKSGHFKMHPRYIKWRTYFSGGYDNRPEYKAEFEKRHGLTTEEARGRIRSRYATIINLSPRSLHEEVETTSHGGICQTTTLMEKISDEEQIAIGGSGAAGASAYTARQMELMAVVSDFESRCEPKDFEIWVMVERDNLSQPEVAEMLGLEKSDILNAMRRVERVRKDYARNVELADRRMDFDENRGGNFTTQCHTREEKSLIDEFPRKRGRPSKEDLARRTTYDGPTRLSFFRR